MNDEERAVNEAMSIAQTPREMSDLKPHERVIAGAIGQAAYTCIMSDIELVEALERVLAHLKYKIAEIKEQRGDKRAI